uniref:Uncharacterized protein n=1 Tax=Pseudo-nitzschia australis TaxID=44445 RepID=A0A7S4ELZ6_9STRA|mmetsp:Transcript_15103/g.31218  ORF Transcript_15103/g.31218 Transcript_15103/m.31218 type:complete len:137 (-) Transcript_15103:866-1276(-)|eukprot:CAMPEP_0168191884 /NCGR_PEP_ID=MMETSP0139_2-20121125/17753_1 /TAXON_ID=44445 /ORGANISM="Pseudo-nitzschia australis, Strain 10249 10 AB" /LENGTH=136 /DNA_ID=CAMNT_0008115087 /DNA_START=73 /DNA_END=483 /DNA_ORIENTATION=-
MPQSNKGINAQRLKANRAAGIGDEKGRLPARVKTEAMMICCTICKSEMKCTKTNTEMKLHSESKHGKTLEECFPGAEAEQKAILKKLDDAKSGGGGKGGKGGGGLTKAQLKKKNAAMANDLLSAGLSTGKKSGKKK